MAKEKRIAPRRRVLKAGSINFDGEAIPCTVRNLSTTGAALDVEPLLCIPDRFNLFVESEKLNQPCHVAWREERRVGVVFDRGRGSSQKRSAAKLGGEDL
jgi:hypothetical protein